MKVVVGPVEVAGFVASLTSGLQAVGVSAEGYVSASHRFGYDLAAKSQPLVVRLWRSLGNFRATSPSQSLPSRVAFFGFQFLLSWLVLFRSIFAFDAYIYVFGKTFTNTRLELVLLRILKKKIIFVYLGSDCRPPYMSGGYLAGVPASRAAGQVVRATKRMSKKIRFQERMAHYVVNAPGTGQFHDKKFVNWFSIGVPVSEAHQSAASVPTEERAVRILHSPSKPLIKGSEMIRSVIAGLQEKGYLIDFVELKGVPNSKVRDELSRCDFVIDQLYSDTPMAFFATEAAHYGKPAVVGGYFSAMVDDYVASSDLPPSAYVMPEQLEETVARLIDDDSYRVELGQAAREFVSTRWDSRSVAERYLRLLKGDVPESWMCSPYDLSYVSGCGVDQDHLISVGRHIVDNFGWSAFCLDGKPALEKHLAELLNRPVNHDA